MGRNLKIIPANTHTSLGTGIGISSIKIISVYLIEIHLGLAFISGFLFLSGLIIIKQICDNLCESVVNIKKESF